MMKLLFFASLRERLEVDQEQWPELQGANTVADILQQLQQRGEPWCSVLDAKRILVAVNQEIASLDTTIHQNDEIAFFPPVTGG